ncbi:MAG: hypothetical protein H6644_20840 [Caldilineaceae bacterium]|nr:hypothetical protein [Caldilineaceae bacterium]
MAAPAKPASNSQRVTQTTSSLVRTVLTATKKRLMPSSNSAKRRMKKLLARLWVKPLAKAKTIISMKSSTSSPKGDARNSRSCPVISLKTHTKKSASSAASKKVGLKPMLKGRLAKGSTKSTPASATKPQCVSLRISVPPTMATASASAINGPKMPTTRAMASAPSTSSSPSMARRVHGLGDSIHFCTVVTVPFNIRGSIPQSSH